MMAASDLDASDLPVAVAPAATQINDDSAPTDDEEASQEQPPGESEGTAGRHASPRPSHARKRPSEWSSSPDGSSVKVARVDSAAMGEPTLDSQIDPAPLISCHPAAHTTNTNGDAPPQPQPYSPFTKYEVPAPSLHHLQQLQQQQQAYHHAIQQQQQQLHQQALQHQQQQQHHALFMQQAVHSLAPGYADPYAAFQSSQSAALPMPLPTLPPTSQYGSARQTSPMHPLAPYQQMFQPPPPVAPPPPQPTRVTKGLMPTPANFSDLLHQAYDEAKKREAAHALTSTTTSHGAVVASTAMPPAAAGIGLGGLSRLSPAAARHRRKSVGTSRTNLTTTPKHAPSDASAHDTQPPTQSTNGQPHPQDEWLHQYQVQQNVLTRTAATADPPPAANGAVTTIKQESSSRGSHANGHSSTVDQAMASPSASAPSVASKPSPGASPTSGSPQPLDHPAHTGRQLRSRRSSAGVRSTRSLPDDTSARSMDDASMARPLKPDPDSKTSIKVEASESDVISSLLVDAAASAESLSASPDAIPSVHPSSDGEGDSGYSSADSSLSRPHSRLCRLLVSYSKRPIQILHVNMKRPSYADPEQQSQPPVGVDGDTGPMLAVRIMGLPTLDELFFVAKDVVRTTASDTHACLLIHTRRGNVAKSIASFSDSEKARMPVLCPRSNGSSSTHVLSVLTLKGVQHLLTNSRSALAPRVLTWLTAQANYLCEAAALEPSKSAQASEQEGTESSAPTFSTVFGGNGTEPLSASDASAVAAHAVALTNTLLADASRQVVPSSQSESSPTRSPFSMHQLQAHQYQAAIAQHHQHLQQQQLQLHQQQLSLQHQQNMLQHPLHVPPHLATHPYAYPPGYGAPPPPSAYAPPYGMSAYGYPAGYPPQAAGHSHPPAAYSPYGASSTAYPPAAAGSPPYFGYGAPPQPQSLPPYTTEQ